MAESADEAELLEWGKRRKQEANARHRERKRAAKNEQAEQAGAAVAKQGTKTAKVAVAHALQLAADTLAAEIAMEKLAVRELENEHAAMSAMQAYQEEASQVLRLGALGERLQGEAALLSATATAMADTNPAAAAARMRGPSKPPMLQELSASHSHRGESDSSGSRGMAQPSATRGQAEFAGAAQAAQQQTSAAASRAPEGASPAVNASGASSAAFAGASSSAASATATTAGDGASGSATMGAGGEDGTVSEEESKGWLRQLMDKLWVRDYWEVSHPLISRSIVKLAALAHRYLPVSQMYQRNRLFMETLQHAVARWEALPAQRPQIEAVIAARLSDRVYIMTELARHRPADLMQVWSKMLCPAPPADQAPSPDGKPPLHEVLLSIALYLEAHLTPAQTTQLQHDWAAYQAAVTRAREARVAAAASLQYGAALHGVNWQKQATLATGGSTAERSEAYLLMAEGTGCLASLGTEELLAMVDLQAALARVLTPIQMARVFLAAFPYNPDMTQLCPWLIVPRQPMQASEAAAPAASTHTVRSGVLDGAHPMSSGGLPSDAAASGSGSAGMGQPPRTVLVGAEVVDQQALSFLLADLSGGGDASGTVTGSAPAAAHPAAAAAAAASGTGAGSVAEELLLGDELLAADLLAPDQEDLSLLLAELGGDADADAGAPGGADDLLAPFLSPPPP